jgi:putative transposase
MSKRFTRLSHTIYECKYHIVFCPKYRFRIFTHDLAEYTRRRIYLLCSQKDLIEILELNIQEDHIHMVLSVPPKYSVSTLMGYLKGKLALKLFQQYEALGKRYWGRHLWARGYCVNTIGLNEDEIRTYVKWQEQKEKVIERQQQRLI